jgi:hypothetical protein
VRLGKANDPNTLSLLGLFARRARVRCDDRGRRMTLAKLDYRRGTQSGSAGSSLDAAEEPLPDSPGHGLGCRVRHQLGGGVGILTRVTTRDQAGE